MQRLAFAMILHVLTALLAVPSADAETRLALVMGNAAYRQTTTLDNPVNDAKLVAATLRKQQFDVSEHIDADLRQMRRALQGFFAKVERAGKDAVVAIYYAGHGVQVGGTNFLIPVDAEIDSESGVASDSIRADDIMQGVAQVGTRLNVVILDACRNNPFRGFRAQTRGLAQIEAPTGTLVAFATAPGSVARDGPKGGNSPYTAALVEAIAKPDLKIEDVFKRVRQVVSTATRGEQVPWESSSLIGDFFPAGRSAATSTQRSQPPLPPGQLPAQQSAASEAWAHAKDSRSIPELEDFVRRFGDTWFGDQAKRRLDELKRAAEEQRLAALEKQRTDEASKTAKAEARQKDGGVAVVPPATPPFDREGLVRALQRELARAGCNPGPVDGQWGDLGQRAMERFARERKLDLEMDEPTPALLDAVRATSGPVCPVVCGSGEKLVGGKCVDEQPRSAAPPERVPGALSSEPGPGRLRPGQRVLVDDGSCPSGKIKELIGGSNRVYGTDTPKSGSERQRRCITR